MNIFRSICTVTGLGLTLLARPLPAAVFVHSVNLAPQNAGWTNAVNLPQFDRDAWVVGGTYWIDPDVALKVDYSHVRSQSQVVPAPRSLNIGLGWWF